jgi:hypothetical protein
MPVQLCPTDGGAVHSSEMLLQNWCHNPEHHNMNFYCWEPKIVSLKNVLILIIQCARTFSDLLKLSMFSQSSCHEDTIWETEGIARLILNTRWKGPISFTLWQLRPWTSHCAFTAGSVVCPWGDLNTVALKAKKSLSPIRDPTQIPSPTPPLSV